MGKHLNKKVGKFFKKAGKTVANEALKSVSTALAASGSGMVLVPMVNSLRKDMMNENFKETKHLMTHPKKYAQRVGKAQLTENLKNINKFAASKGLGMLTQPITSNLTKDINSGNWNFHHTKNLFSSPQKYAQQSAWAGFHIPVLDKVRGSELLQRGIGESILHGNPRYARVAAKKSRGRIAIGLARGLI